VSRPAPWTTAVLAQAGIEARLTARRGENLLAMVGVPVALLLFFGSFVGGRGAVQTLLPGTLAIALVASGLVNLGIATAYERGYGVLKRLGGSPLGRSGLVAAKSAVVALIATAQVIGLVAVAVLVLGWRPGPDASVAPAAAMAAIAVTTVVGAAAFAGLGLTIAGTLRPEATLVVANVLFLLALGLGGALVPIGALPAPVAVIARLSPVGALAEAFGAALGDGTAIGQPLGILLMWAVVAVIAAGRTFRWD
jgi:ABC-2 type transport system permease protein